MADLPPLSRQVVIHVDQTGGLGNRMIQHMAALYLLSRVPYGRLSGSVLPEWKIYQPRSLDGSERAFVVRRDTHMRMPLEAIMRDLTSGAADCVAIHNYAQHMDNFLAYTVYQKVFVDSEPQTGLVADDELLINIRGAEILSGGAPDYLILPVEYYRQIVDETGLKPVIMGQIGPGPYLDRLRAALPEARLIPSRGIMEDFSLIRNARHIVVAISTFSWLAAWLSNAEQIFFPVAGVFSPFQRSDIGLLPLDDPRFRFDLFPVYFAEPVERLLPHLSSLKGWWRRISHHDLRAAVAAWPRVPFDFEKAAKVFDEAFYLQTYWDVRGAKDSGTIPSGFEHFVRVGHRELREPFRLDRAWYCRRYPLAGLELSQGSHLNCYHHYLDVGAERGYSPVPV